jgi:cell division protein FtsQ
VRFRRGRSRKQQKREQLLYGFGRWLIFGVAAILAIALLSGIFVGLRHLLFYRNPNFQLRSVELNIYGDLKREQVREKLSNMGIAPGTANIFAVDLGELRRELEQWHVLVKRVTVSRRLPGTLIIDLYERHPVAQLLAPKGRLIDSQGLILPARNDPRFWLMPIITGVKDAGELQIGATLDDELAQGALKLLELTSTESYGRFLEINLIQLDYAGKSLKVFLRERPPFREGACVVLPAGERKMKAALNRVTVIAKERLRGRQSTGFIDATYEVNIPTRP